MTAFALPDRFEDEAHLEDLMSTPSPALAEELSRLDGDLIVLGVAGKVGPTLARMAKRAAPDKRVVGVARFSEPGLEAQLNSWGVETIRCDLLEPDQVAKLPKLKNVVYMAGKKFGTDEDPSFAWAMNTWVPAQVAREFRESRIVAFSTLCVYPFGPVVQHGWDERTEPAPYGDYANSCVGRERAFGYGSRRWKTPGRLIRLNYSIDMRYGVLIDIANWVRNEEPIQIATGHASVIWQGDTNDQILRALGHCTTPTSALNVGGPELASVRMLAHEFGRRFGKTPVFEGTEQPTAWVNNTLEAQRLFGYPRVPLARLIDWVADWVERGLVQWHKPTGYQVRDGGF